MCKLEKYKKYMSICTFLLICTSPQYAHFKYIEPHVNPPPNAANIKLSPFLNLLSHSHKHNGIVPFVVLP
jgi:hypothetical protein